MPEIQLDEDPYPNYDYDSLPEVALFEEPDYESFIVPNNDESAVDEDESPEDVLEEPPSPVKVPSPRKPANVSSLKESPVKKRLPLAGKCCKLRKC